MKISKARLFFIISLGSLAVTVASLVLGHLPVSTATTSDAIASSILIPFISFAVAGLFFILFLITGIIWLTLTLASRKKHS